MFDQPKSYRMALREGSHNSRCESSGLKGMEGSWFGLVRRRPAGPGAPRFPQIEASERRGQILLDNENLTPV